MNKNTYKASITFNILLLLTGCVTSAYAQPAKGAPENPSRQPGQERRRPNTENYDRGAAEQATEQPLNSVRVSIRYKKELGYKSESGTGGDGPTSCAAFSVRPESSIGRNGVLIPVSFPGKMRDEHGYYYCDFIVSELPFDKKITIIASMAYGENPTEAWRGGSQPQPQSGWRRAVDEGSRSVVLTTDEPRAVMNFEMVYQLYQPSDAREDPRRGGRAIFSKP